MFFVINSYSIYLYWVFEDVDFEQFFTTKRADFDGRFQKLN